MRIDSIESMERAATDWGILPFFRNGIRGFSVQEMAAPGALFGDEEGCWEWKGPVIRERTTAYGKFFRHKAGFVSKALLPDFLNYRRNRYPIAEGSVEEMILDIIRISDSLSSTQLKKLIFGDRSKKRVQGEFVDTDFIQWDGKRKSLEGPLQRLQMGGWLLISDFQYKLTRRGERYGWGVAVYSTPEAWLPDVATEVQCSPEESLEHLVAAMALRLPHIDKSAIRKLLE